MREGLAERLEWMARNVYAFCTCGVCMQSGWCDSCKRSTLRANGGMLPGGFEHEQWDPSRRRALEAFIQKHRDAGTDPLGDAAPNSVQSVTNQRQE